MLEGRPKAFLRMEPLTGLSSQRPLIKLLPCEAITSYRSLSPPLPRETCFAWIKTIVGSRNAYVARNFGYLAFSLTERHGRQSENSVLPNHRKPQFVMTAWQLCWQAEFGREV